MSGRAWAAFGAVSILWGLPYLLIRVAVEDGVSPVFVSWTRVVLGAAVLLALAWRAGVLGALRGRLRWLVLLSVFEIAVPFTLIAAGEQRVSSSLAAIVIAAAPLAALPLASLSGDGERPGATAKLGLVLGLAGVVALVGIEVSGSSAELVGASAILVAACCYAVGATIFKRRLADVDPRASMGASLALAALLLTPAAALDAPVAAPPASADLALVGLGIFCTAAALALYGVLIAEAGPARALVITYVNPLIALALGIVVLGERPGLGAAFGLPVILAGTWLGTGGRVPGPLNAVVVRRRLEPRGAFRSP